MSKFKHFLIIKKIDGSMTFYPLPNCGQVKLDLICDTAIRYFDDCIESSVLSIPLKNLLDEEKSKDEYLYEAICQLKEDWNKVGAKEKLERSQNLLERTIKVLEANELHN